MDLNSNDVQFSQKSNSNQNDSGSQAPNLFKISQNISPFSSIKKQIAKTPQDNFLKQKINVLLPQLKSTYSGGINEGQASESTQDNN